MKTKTLCLVACAAMAMSSGARADQVFSDDVIIRHSLCVGYGCAAGMDFQSDTLVLRGDVLSILFDDTSPTGTRLKPFARNDWRLIINDPGFAGASYFAVEDATAHRQVFRVGAGARSNSIYVAPSGYVGFGTSTPGNSLHVVKNIMPGLRLEQTGEQLFRHYIWDIEGGDQGFDVFDVTAGTFPFIIRPGAPSSSIFVAFSGYVGLGTTMPAQPLHVVKGDTPSLRLEQDISISNPPYIWDVGGNHRSFFIRDVTGGNGLPFNISSGAPNASFDIAASGNVGIGVGGARNRLTVNSGGAVTQVHFGSGSSGAGGGFLMSNQTSEAIFSGGAEFVSAWTARSTGSAFIQAASGNLTFFTNGGLTAGNTFTPSQRMVIDSSGNVAIGAGSPAAQLHTTGTVRFAGVANCGAGIQTDASGNLSCIVSSRRFKTITGALPYDVALANVMALRPQQGSYKKTPDVPEHWLIAEDVAAVDPALAGFADGKPYTVKTQNVVADLVAVVQHQQRQIDDLKQALAEKSKH